jgi:hypothetical protein
MTSSKTSCITTVEAPNDPSMLLVLVGQKDWKALKRLVDAGRACDNVVVSDCAQMLAIITLAIACRAPFPILHFLCHLNPDALVMSDIPFQLAHEQGSNMQTFVALKSARRRALTRTGMGLHRDFF